MPTPETKAMLAAAVAACEDKQAEDLRILELDPADSGLTDYFLLMTGSNSRQIQTLADEIELRLKKEFGEMPHSREGYKQAEWVLLDYVDFVVHIFSREKRQFYALERLRKTASGVTPEQLKAALAERTTKSRGAQPDSTPAKKGRRKGAPESPVRDALAASAASRPAAKKAPAKKTLLKKSPAAAKRPPGSRVKPSGAAAKKSTAAKATARKSAAKKSTSRKPAKSDGGES